MTFGICVSHDHGYVRFVVVTIPFRDFFLIRAIQWASRMEQNLVTLPEHLLTPLKYSCQNACTCEFVGILHLSV
jgi:hypothetical protein